ncbi:molybdopterin-binding domain of aldehyde dehydrogenase domain-containing protein [Ditylenchus destructor]|nr:molybdopterin-binding domain of aldehyde dehydrogenase domain-containing protein [Ditylenchus destructor]
MISQHITVTLEVNGRKSDVSAMADTPLLLVLRNDLELNGPKYGCGLGECGACTVIIDGVAARSCVFPLSGAVGREIVTLEGLGTRDAPHPVQQAFIDEQAAQCGYCLNGMIMTTKALLGPQPQPQRSAGAQRAVGQPLPLRHPYRNPARGVACGPPDDCGLMTMTDTSLSRDQWLAKTGVLLIIDDVLPPSGPVAKGGTPTVKPKELGLFIAVNDDGLVYAFNGHVDLGTGIRTSLAQIVAEELDLTMEQISAVPLRNAAAEARRFLLARAAGRLGVSTASLKVDAGVIHAADGRTTTYAELVSGQHDQLRISGDAPLKPIEDYRLVGKGAARVDIPGKATGELTYVHDMRVPGMLHGRVIRPPYAGLDCGDFVGNSLLSVDESSIAHVPGIVAVVVIRDFVGVVALREEQAVKAASELQVHWKPWNHGLPDMTDVEQAIRDNPRVRRTVLDQGNVDEALAGASQRMPRSYLWPYQMHGSIGPSCGVADYSPAGSRVWSGSQNPHLLRADLAWLLACDEALIDVIRMEAAGCYGRNCADDVCADALLLSRTPVGTQGTAQLMDVDGGLNADGSIAAYDFETSYPSNGAPTLALLLTGRVEPVAAMFEMGDRTSIPPYDIDTMRVTINDMAPIVRASWMRGVSALPNTFAHESYIDELAFAAGVDPVEYRLRYLKDERAIDLVKSTAERANWTPRTQVPGFGAAWAAWVADVAIDKQTGDVSVTRVVIGHDSGMMINPDGVQHQIHGNVIQSTSRVLKERVTFEESTVASKEWGGYPILTFPEVPKIDVMMMPRQDQPPMGAGESASVPSAAAIANAIYDATGIRFRELPITPERVLAALNAGTLGEPAKSPEKRRKWWFGALFATLGAVLATAWPFHAEIPPIAPPSAGTWSKATLERGRLLAAVGDCAVCHTAPGGATNAGGLAMQTPFGTLYSSNITPDVKTGIGAWSYRRSSERCVTALVETGATCTRRFPIRRFAISMRRTCRRCMAT